MPIKISLLAAIISGIGGGGSTTWRMPLWPTPSAITWTGGSGPSGSPATGVELLTAIQTLGAGAGGTVYLTAGVNYGDISLANTGVADVFVVTAGTESQYNRDASLFPSSSRATINKLSLPQASSGVTPSHNAHWMCINFGGPSFLGGEIISCGFGTLVGGSFKHYGCEFQSFAITPFTYPVFLNLTDTSGFTVGQTGTASVSGSQYTVLLVQDTRILVDVTLVGPGSGTNPSNGSNIPFLAGSDVVGGQTVNSLTAYAVAQAYAARGVFKDYFGQQSYYHDLVSGDKFNVTDSVRLVGNWYDMSYSDMVAIGTPNPRTALIEVQFCTMSRPLGMGTDYENPHVDAFQLLGGGTSNYNHIILRGNIVLQAPGTLSRAGVQGGMFLDDVNAPGAFVHKICGNVIVDLTANAVPTNSAVSSRARSSIMFSNKLLSNFASPVRQADAGRTHKDGVIIEGNQNSGATQSINNTNYTAAPNAESHNAVYSGFPLTLTSNVADAINEIKSKAVFTSSGLMGAYSGYVDYINRQLDLTLEPIKFVYSTVLNASLNSNAESGSWRKFWSDYDQSAATSNGEFRIADDELGTNAGPWQTSGIIPAYKWVQLRVPTGNSGATSNTATITIGGRTSSFSAVTAPTEFFTGVDNGGTAWSLVTVPNQSALRGVLAVRFKLDTLTTGRMVFATTTSGFFLSLLTSTSLRIQFGGSARRFNIPIVPTLGQYYTLIVSYDLSKTTADEAVKVTLDSQEVLPQSPTWTATGAISFGNFGLLASNTGTSPLDGGIQFFWHDFGDETYELPDITSTDYYAKFYAQTIGVNGEGPMGYIPDLYYSGTVAEWNAGFANKGSLAAALTATGTYI